MAFSVGNVDCSDENQPCNVYNLSVARDTNNVTFPWGVATYAKLRFDGTFFDGADSKNYPNVEVTLYGGNNVPIAIPCATGFIEAFDSIPTILYYCGGKGPIIFTDHLSSGGQNSIEFTPIAFYPSSAVLQEGCMEF